MQDTSHLHIEFFSQTVEDVAATAQLGLPKFKDVEFVRIKYVGDKHSELVAPASDQTFCPERREQISWKEQFPRHYAAFAENRSILVDGTPLDELPGITGSKVAELKAQRVFSIEALAGLDGTLLQRLGPGAREWKGKAETWLMKAREGALDTKLAAQNAQMQDQLASLRAQIEAMGGKATDEPVKAEVVTEGRFMGHTAGDLRRYIEATSGTKVKGNPKLATLKTMAEEVASAAEINA
jgi:hypothetical protein